MPSMALPSTEIFTSSVRMVVLAAEALTPYAMTPQDAAAALPEVFRELTALG